MRRRRRFTGSIRFRLAAWYAAIVLAVIVAMGFAFSILLERELRSDVDARIQATADRVKREIEGVAIDPRTGELIDISSPPPDFYAFPSLLIQVVNSSNDVVISSSNLYLFDGRSVRVLPSDDAPNGSFAPVFHTGVLDGVNVRTVKLPLVPVNSDLPRTIGSVIVGEPLTQLEETLEHARTLLAIGAVISVAFAALAGWFLARRALRPVDRITATAAAIAGGKGVGQALSNRLEVGRSGDELARLSETFNRMLDRLQETFESQRRFLADASHELRTPLTAIRGNVDVLSRQVDLTEAGGDVNETVEDLRRESERMRRLIEDLLSLARAEAPLSDDERWTDVALDDLVNEAVRIGGALAEGRQITAFIAGPVRVRGDRDRLLQVLLILIDNAIRYTPGDGAVTVTVGREPGGATIRVSDTGAGIAPQHLPHLFERFYRADSSRQRGSGGIGLGLSIARAIVESHNGSIAAASRLGEGTVFTVLLPALKELRPASSAS